MKMNLFVTLDKNYIGPLRVLLYSLCKNNAKHTFDVYVLHTTLNPEDFKEIEQDIDPAQCRVIGVELDESYFKYTPTSGRWPKEAYYRILAVKFLPQDLDRALYLDPDIVNTNDISGLYNIELSNYFFAAASHMYQPMNWYSRARLKMSRDSVFINSGVMLFNLNVLRKKQDIDEMYDYINKNRDHLYLFDQDILNGLYHEKTIQINPLQYNLNELYFHLFNMNPFAPSKTIDYEWVKRNTVLIHFCGKNKPWNDDYKGKFDKLFYEPYARELAQAAEIGNQKEFALL